MKKKSVYLNQRIKKETVQRLRKFEKKNLKTASISKSIDYLLEFFYQSMPDNVRLNH